MLGSFHIVFIETFATRASMGALLLILETASPGLALNRVRVEELISSDADNCWKVKSST